ncbi:hypothetical protein AOLI_G00195490 [Acnodon oligacanthus]
MKPPPDSQVLKIRNILDLQGQQKIGKVIYLQTCSEVVNAFGVSLEKKECWIADATGKISLVFYDGQIRQVLLGRSYEFCCVSTRSQGRLHLTTTRSTTVEEIPAVEVPEAFSFTETPAEVFFSTQGLVCGVELQEKRTCSRCRQMQNPFDRKSINHRCQSCRLLQKTVSFPAKVSGTVVRTCGSADIHLTPTMTVLKDFVEYNQLCHLLQDVESIEEYLLSASQLVVEHSDANMVASVRLGTEVSGGQCGMLSQSSTEEAPEANTAQSQGNAANIGTAAGSAESQEQDQVHGVAQAMRLLEQNP